MVGVDTLYFTHRGPMQHRGARWLSIRWTVLEPGDEAVGFAAVGTLFDDVRNIHDNYARSGSNDGVKSVAAPGTLYSYGPR